MDRNSGCMTAVLTQEIADFLRNNEGLRRDKVMELLSNPANGEILDAYMASRNWAYTPEGDALRIDDALVIFLTVRCNDRVRHVPHVLRMPHVRCCMPGLSAARLRRGGPLAHLLVLF
jgi:hypothetical protein